MKPSLPVMLSVNGGYVDTAGFLALHGLFTTHVTGNFVTLGAALVLGTSGAVAKLLALPMFWIVVIATRLLSGALAARNYGMGVPVLRALVGLKVALLILGAALAIGLGPFASGDGWAALLTGMTLVAAMAIQNAIHRIHMSAAPPTTIMTGNTTQIMIDLADLMRGVPADARNAIRSRLSRMSGSVAAFAAGCAAAALIYAKQDVWCFLLPPIIGGCSLWLRELHPP
ncbi:MAG TPA: YoaK family protein [Steroidobacteraceae bacterium]|nr:YoaK family protein [Steroidobacteraceae bacterium]